MTPQEFIDKWKESKLGERQAAQSHFNDLCAMLGVANPTDADPRGEWYCFERGAKKAGGGKGWADVWKKGCFGWEYKGKHKDLDAAYAQLQQYAVALENPPLLVVCDTEEVRIHTNWTNSVSETHILQLEELADLRHRTTLKAIFTEPEKLRPKKTRDALTAEMAERFARLAKMLVDRGHNAQLVAHFLNRLIFCMYAEDADLLPNNMFTRLLNNAFMNPGDFNEDCANLFKVMQKGGRFGLEKVDWFNGNLFDDDMIVPLNRSDIGEVRAAANMNWSDIDPSILGTLFERGLDPDKRGELGAHYTDREKIMLIIKPVIRRPLKAEWEKTKQKIAAEMTAAAAATSSTAAKKHKDAAAKLHHGYVEKLANLRVLDPACGSGNFLYLALRTLKDLEHKANLEAEELGLKRGEPLVGPQVVKGIEISPYAAELARVSVWIGELQWMKRHGFDVAKNPILKPLETIENRDALLGLDGIEAEWPDADFIIGNPPFLGDRKMIRGLGEPYVRTLRRCFDGRVPGGADLVCYWFEKALAQVKAGNSRAAGLVSTNSIRGGANRAVLERVVEDERIFEAWSDEPWVIDGAAVRVSLVCFAPTASSYNVSLNGENVSAILADLTPASSGSNVDLTKSLPLRENQDTAFIGTQKNGPFEVGGDEARRMLGAALNPNGRPNSDVLRPWINGSGVVQQRDDKWIIDFGPRMSEEDAALYEIPFNHVVIHVQPTRIHLRRQWHRTKWWLHGDPRPAMRAAIARCARYLVTPRVSKHRVFVWAHPAVLPDSAVVAVARDDDTSFGILHSRFHELWSLRLGTSLEDRPRYTPTTCFETFPFPSGLTPNISAKDYAADPRAAAIAEAAKKLNELREAWLNPPDLIKRMPEVVLGYPDRILPKDAKADKELKKRTLTNLYNARPAWLANAHRELDAAVAAAYGWPAELSDDEILQRLFDLNQERAKKQAVNHG